MDAPIDAQFLENARRKLVGRGESLLVRSRRTLAEFDRIGEFEVRILALIRASLERMAQGTFGNCVICHGTIEIERLRAIPEVDRCGGCTHRSHPVKWRRTGTCARF